MPSSQPRSSVPGANGTLTLVSVGSTSSAWPTVWGNDPVDGSVISGQGVRILFREDARAVFRLSGTGTVGATLRVYLERFEKDPGRHEAATANVLAPVAAAANAIAGIEAHTGRASPSIIT